MDGDRSPTVGVERVDPDDQIVETLTRILLDDLGPALEAYRRATARRLGLEPVDLLCLDVVRRLGAPTPTSALPAWTGLTRSALSTAMRRLEAQGHLRRTPVPGSCDLVVELIPHARRDAELEQRRTRVRDATRWTVAEHRLTTPSRGEAVRSWALATMTCLFREAKAVAPQATQART